MSNGNGFWQATDFFKGFLTSRWRFRQLSYVVLAHIPPSSLDQRCGSSLDFSAVPFAEECDWSSAEPERQSPNPFSSPVKNPAERDLQFYLFHRDDVETPPVKYVAEPSKIDRCFFMCERENCQCKSLHVRPDAWRIRLDTIEQTADLVCYSEERIERLKWNDIRPTAGYFYALGLCSQEFTSVFPRICPLGHRCPRNKTCLFIHLDHSLEANVTEPLTANIRLTSLPVYKISDAAQNILAAKGLQNVGDMQMMSSEAYDAFLSQAPEEYMDELLSVSTCRFFDPFSSLAKVLATFPHMPEDYVAQVSLFPKVSDVLKLTPSELYSKPLAVEITNALEIIRKRLEPEDPFTSLHLEDLDKNAFIHRSLRLILETAGRYAHYSWRRHDPKRPVVTSMITFVNVGTCKCGRYAMPFEEDTEWEYSSDYTRRELLPAPHGSWCDCPRMWEVAVNYELSTPMGSRCSEQNVMAAIACSGAPTWSIREVVVHGNKPNSEMNPLFPCGVCENMLRKNEMDVRSHYGRHIMLYMFDATIPAKVFSLPVREISLRDNPRFKRLIGED